MYEQYRIIVINFVGNIFLDFRTQAALVLLWS